MITQFRPVISIVLCILTDDYAARSVIYIVPCNLTAEPAARPVVYIFPYISTDDFAAWPVIYIVPCILKLNQQHDLLFILFRAFEQIIT